MSELIGVKNIEIYIEAVYPIMSCYEFEFLKKERVVQEYMKDATIYMILQRPLVTFNNVTKCDDEIHATLTDNQVSIPIKIYPFVKKISGGEKTLQISTMFYTKAAQRTPPFNDVPAFKIEKENGELLHLITPQKAIFEYLKGAQLYDIDGDPFSLQDYKVHYIGQSFDQDIWNRLTGHEKVQSVLTIEDSMSLLSNKNSYEVCLMLLKVTGFKEEMLIANRDSLNLKSDSITHSIINSGDGRKFSEPWIPIDDKCLTNEVEAYLVDYFKPQYNTILFKEYPRIKSGTRSKGYDSSEITLSAPASLYSDSESIVVKIINKIPRKGNREIL